MNEEDKKLIEAVNYLKKEKSKEGMQKFLSMCGKAVPKGIRHPDSLIRNKELYLSTKSTKRGRLL